MTADTANPPKLEGREKQLVKAVFSTPQGRELIEIWKSRIVKSPYFTSPMPDEVLRHAIGRLSVYRDIILIQEEPTK